MDSRYTGPYRRVSADEANALMDAGAAVEHDEGCGWVVYDDEARRQFRVSTQAQTTDRERIERLERVVAQLITYLYAELGDRATSDLFGMLHAAPRKEDDE